MSYKIRIKGYQNLIEISDSQGQKLKELWIDQSVSEDEKISVGALTVLKGSILGIIEPKDEQLPESKGMADSFSEYYRERNRLLALDPIHRAQQSGPAYFRLAYKGIKGDYIESPTNEMIEDWLIFLQKKYLENPEWSKPSLRWFFEFMNFTKEKQFVEGNILRILESCEYEEVFAIENKKKFLENRANKEDGIQPRVESKEVSIENF